MEEDMRVRPSVGIGVGLAAAYMIVFGGLLKLSGVGYDDVTASADNALKALVIPVGIAVVVFAIVTSIFGWWKPVLRDRQRAGGWLIVVPIVMLLGLLAGVDYGNLQVLDSKLLLWIGIGTAFVGIGEELMYRGLVVVSFRGSMSEIHVWLWSSVAFGLLHSINVLLGQSLGATIQQVVVTFVIGSGLYVARRATGWIIAPMFLHLLWDYSAFTQGDGRSAQGTIQLLLIVVVIVALVAGRKQLFGTAGDPVNEAVS